MDRRIGRINCLGFMLLIVIMACNLPVNVVPTQTISPVSTAMLTRESPTISTTGAISPTPSDTPTPTDTWTPTITPTPQSPLVIVDSMCWSGPGTAYEVISTIRSGTRVVLMGRGVIEGWWIVKNPIYHDPCWLPTASLQVDPAMEVSGLPVYKIPPTPTP